MKVAIALVAVVIFLTTCPPQEMRAINFSTKDTLPDSLKKLRHFADSQDIQNIDKIQELEIKTLELEMINAKKDSMKKPAWLKAFRNRINKWRGKKEIDYKIIYKRKIKDHG